MEIKLDDLFAELSDSPDITPAPASLRSHIYSAMVREAARSIPLRPLSESQNAGYAICDWERLTRHVPGGESRNHCTICHARVLAETFDSVSMPWPGCPYHKLHSR